MSKKIIIEEGVLLQLINEEIGKFQRKLQLEAEKESILRRLNEMTEEDERNDIDEWFGALKTKGKKAEDAFFTNNKPLFDILKKSAKEKDKETYLSTRENLLKIANEDYKSNKYIDGFTQEERNIWIKNIKQLITNEDSNALGGDKTLLQRLGGGAGQQTVGK